MNGTQRTRAQDGRDAAAGNRGQAYPGTPRWVKLSIAVVALIVAVLLLATVLGLRTPGGPGGHGL